METRRISIQKVYSKGSRRLNEDALLIKGNIFGVFDGSSSLVKFVDKKGRTGGKIASTITKKVFSQDNKSLQELAVEANLEIKRQMEREKIDVSKKENLWGTKVAVVRIKNKEAECFQIGDSLIFIIRKDGFNKLLFGYKNHELETLKKWKKISEKKVKNIWNVLENQLIKTRRKVNVSYGCLDGEKEAAKFFNYQKVKLKNIKSIILFTDGLFLLKKDPSESDNWDAFTKIYNKSGLKGILKKIRDLENKDPYCWDYPRLKKHDDIAAIGIDFS